MRTSLLIASAVALVMSAGAALAQDVQDKGPAETSRNAETTALYAAEADYQQGHCDRVLERVEPLLKPETAARVEPLLFAHAYTIAASCKLQAQDKDAAYRYARAGTALPDATEWLWRVRLGLELDDKRWADGIATVEAMHRDAPPALNSVETRWLYSFSRELKDSQPALRRRLLAVLADPAYVPDGPLETTDYFRKEYAGLLFDAGNRKGAAALVHGIALTPVLLDIAYDPRFRGTIPSDYDFRAATERHLAEAREAIADYPDLLAPMVEAAGALRQLGRPQESIDLLETAHARVLGQGKPFADAGEKLNWWWDALARAHEMLGQPDQAIAAFRFGVAAREDGATNVSQTINLAHAQNRFGRPREALATLAKVDASFVASPYGNAEMHLALGCAHAQLGEQAAAAEDLAYLSAHAKDHPDALTHLQLCMNDLDGAAAGFIAKLADPDQRSRALIDLSDYDAPPVPLPHDLMRTRLPVLKARPDVRAAIARAGGVRRIHLQATEL